MLNVMCGLLSAEGTEITVRLNHHRRCKEVPIGSTSCVVFVLYFILPRYWPYVLTVSSTTRLAYEVPRRPGLNPSHYEWTGSLTLTPQRKVLDPTCSVSRGGISFAVRAARQPQGVAVVEHRLPACVVRAQKLCRPVIEQSDCRSRPSSSSGCASGSPP
jgi:hypothetical protein